MPAYARLGSSQHISLDPSRSLDKGQCHFACTAAPLPTQEGHSSFILMFIPFYHFTALDCRVQTAIAKSRCSLSAEISHCGHVFMHVVSRSCIMCPVGPMSMRWSPSSPPRLERGRSSSTARRIRGVFVEHKQHARIKSVRVALAIATSTRPSIA
jgi:hypothetical protein